MRCKLALLVALVGLVGCNWLSLEPTVEKPGICGTTTSERMWSETTQDTVTVDRTHICRPTQGGWETSFCNFRHSDFLPPEAQMETCYTLHRWPPQ